MVRLFLQELTKKPPSKVVDITKRCACQTKNRLVKIIFQGLPVGICYSDIDSWLDGFRKQSTRNGVAIISYDSGFPANLQYPPSPRTGITRSCHAIHFDPSHVLASLFPGCENLNGQYICFASSLVSNMVSPPLVLFSKSYHWYDDL